MISSPDVIDLTDWLDTIVEGENLLAIYGANHTTQTGDFLIHPKLTAQLASGAIFTYYMVSPTPGMANGVGLNGVVEDTAFSHDRGFYDTAFNLEITSSTPGATIRYTTDGSIPTLTNGLTYSSPIMLDPAAIPVGNRGVVTVRAAAFKAGFASTNVDTQSYVFLDKVLQQNGTGLPAFTTWGSPPDWAMDPAIVSAVGTAQMKSDLQAIPTMSLVMNWKDIFGDGTSHGIYTENTPWKDSSDERASSFEYFTADGSEEFQIDAAVEIQGHSSTTRWNTDKLSLQVKFKVPYDKKLESSTLFGNSVIDGGGAGNEFDTFILDAQFNYTWLTSSVQQHGVAKYVNDQAVSDLINLAGGTSPHGRWVHLYINGIYWGIYNAHERPDDSFAAEYFGGKEEDYYAIKAFDGVVAHPAQYLQVDGGLAAEAAYANLLTEVGHNLANSVDYQQVVGLLDVDSFIDYMIVHYYAGNWDWGQDNWYATFNHVDVNGRWRFHAWDQEHAWPTDDNLALGESTYNVNYNSTIKDDAFGPTRIQHRLMLSEEYRLKFADRAQELMFNGGLLTPSVAASVFQKRADEIDRAINGESARWGNDRVATSYDRDDWRANIAGLMTDFFPLRTAIALQQFNTVSGVKTDWIPTLDAPLFSQYGGEIASGFDLTLSKPVGSPGAAVIYYTLDDTDPRDATTNLFSSSAIQYSSPINLTVGTQVKARIYFNDAGTANDWSSVVAKTFVLEEPLSLRIVEIMYNPPGSADDTEYFELLNTGSEAIELAGVQITEFSAGGFTFSAGTLNPGERIVAVKNQTAFALAYPGATNVAAGVFTGSLANEGELISLRGPLGELLQSFTYGDSNIAGWPTTPDGSGNSLEYIGSLAAGENPLGGSPSDPFDNPVNWRASLQPSGSPGTDGELNEPDSADFDDDGDVDGRDFLAWQRGHGTANAEKADGDADNDGTVNGDDLVIWQGQYGSPPPLAAISSFADENQIGPSLYWIDSLSTELVVFVAGEEIESGEYVGAASRDDAFAELAPVFRGVDDDFGDIAVCRVSDEATFEWEVDFGEVSIWS
ncbi:MAG: CotH kinase family protein [Bythopirellula sp.]|nr:CotH kinase family protein [Bythopirellula sp.]